MIKRTYTHLPHVIGCFVFNFKIASQVDDRLLRLTTHVSKIIDFEESVAQHRACVKRGIDSDLDDSKTLLITVLPRIPNPVTTCFFLLEKRTFNGLPDLLTRVAEEEMNRLQNEVDECCIVYVPQVPKTYRNVVFLVCVTVQFGVGFRWGTC